MSLSTRCGGGHDERDAHENRDSAQGAEVVDRVKRRVELFGKHHDHDGRGRREDEADDEQPCAVRRGGLARSQRGIEDAKLLALLTLLGGFRKSRIF